MNIPFLYFTKLTGWLPAKLLLKWKLSYEDKSVQGTKLPKGSLLVSNHKSLWDMPLYMMLFFRTPVRFLVGEVIFNKGGFMTWLLTSLGCLKVERFNYDFSFIDQSAKLLKAGKVVGIFPEGQLPRNGRMSRFAPSYVMIALQADADIIPVYTAGKYFSKGSSPVVIGKPVHVSDHFADRTAPAREEIETFNRYIKDKIKELGASVGYVEKE